MPRQPQGPGPSSSLPLVAPSIGPRSLAPPLTALYVYCPGPCHLRFPLPSKLLVHWQDDPDCDRLILPATRAFIRRLLIHETRAQKRAAVDARRGQGA